MSIKVILITLVAAMSVFSHEYNTPHPEQHVEYLMGIFKPSQEIPVNEQQPAYEYPNTPFNKVSVMQDLNQQRVVVVCHCHKQLANEEELVYKCADLINSGSFPERTNPTSETELEENLSQEEASLNVVLDYQTYATLMQEVHGLTKTQIDNGWNKYVLLHGFEFQRQPVILLKQYPAPEIMVLQDLSQQNAVVYCNCCHRKIVDINEDLEHKRIYQIITSERPAQQQIQKPLIDQEISQKTTPYKLKQNGLAKSIMRTWNQLQSSGLITEYKPIKLQLEQHRASKEEQTNLNSLQDYGQEKVVYQNFIELLKAY